MTEHELHDPKQPPRLKALDLGALGLGALDLGALGADFDGLACDIDDPDCEAGAALPPQEGAEQAGRSPEPTAAED
ncbi:MAG: hypothetical protein AB7F65_03090 [Dehalococcoidia bacterium]